MSTASVIIPVYNAEKALVRCVESIVFGRFKDIEVILVDDCSTDSSWEICKQLALKYANVSCSRNERNSGVSYTRNQGLKKATGEYILFVDSDDWVSGRYAEKLIETAMHYPDELVICGMKFINLVDKYETEYIWEKGLSAECIVDKDSFFELPKRFYLQQVYNKAFKRIIIANNNLCFDEKQSMGEDYQFVLDYMEAAKIVRCIAINEILYYYVRANTTSLMSKFGLIENENDRKRLRQLLRIAGENDDHNQMRYQEAIHISKNSAIYHIARAKELSRQEKLSMIEKVAKDGNAVMHLRKQQISWTKEGMAKVVQWAQKLTPRALNRIKGEQVKRYVSQQKKKLLKGDFTVISQNCIGGVFYHDMGMKFLSPTINLFFSCPDFVKFVLNLEYYISLDLNMTWDEEYPIGYLDDIAIHFMHYDTCELAESKWNERKKRINWEKIIVLCTDMEGFDKKTFEEWEKIKYPKILFSAQRWSPRNNIAYPRYIKEGHVLDLIPRREFYKDGLLIQTLNGITDR